MTPSRIVLLLTLSFVFESGCNKDKPLLVHVEHHDPVMNVPVPPQPQAEQKDLSGTQSAIVFDETTIHDLAAFQVITDQVSEKEACRDRDFLAIPVELPRSPLSCGEDGVMYEVRIVNCGNDTLTLTAFDFEVEILRPFKNEDSETALFDQGKLGSFRLRNIRLCNSDDAGCSSATLERMNDKKATLSFSLRDDDGSGDEDSDETIELGLGQAHVFDFKATRPCRPDVFSLLRLNLQLTKVGASIKNGEDAFGAILKSARRAVTVSALR